MQAAARNDDPADLFLRLDAAERHRRRALAGNRHRPAAGSHPGRRQEHHQCRWRHAVPRDRRAHAPSSRSCATTRSASRWAAPRAAAVPFHPIALYDHDGVPVTSMVAAYAVHHGQSVNIADAYGEEGFDFSGTKSFDQKTGYRSRSFLTIPMKDHENAIIGVLQLLNAKDRATGAVGAFSDADLHLAESLASQAAIALTNRLLINRLEAAVRILHRPHQRGDRRQVAVHERPLRARADTDDAAGGRRRRLQGRAAQRLHDVRTRSPRAQDRRPPPRLRKGHHAGPRRRQGDQAAYAVRPHRADRHALRDREARRGARALPRAARGAANGDGAALAALERECAARLAEIDADRAFLRQCNIGGESMRPEDQERVRQIAARYRWRDGSGMEAHC